MTTNLENLSDQDFVYIYDRARMDNSLYELEVSCREELAYRKEASLKAVVAELLSLGWVISYSYDNPITKVLSFKDEVKAVHWILRVSISTSAYNISVLVEDRSRPLTVYYVIGRYDSTVSEMLEDMLTKHKGYKHDY